VVHWAQPQTTKVSADPLCGFGASVDEVSVQFSGSRWSPRQLHVGLVHRIWHSSSVALAA
jgi:hypothetical protein